MEDDLIERDSGNESEERSDVSLSVDASEMDEERGEEEAGKNKEDARDNNVKKDEISNNAANLSNKIRRRLSKGRIDRIRRCRLASNSS